MAKKKKTTAKAPRRAAVVPDGAREKLMVTSQRLFAERGLDGVSVRDISRETELNVSLVSYYFGGKEGLYLAVLEKHARDVEQKLREALAPFKNVSMDRKTFADVMETVISKMVDIRLASPEVSSIIERERLSGFPYAKKIHDEIFDPLANEFIEFMNRAQEKKVIRSDIRPSAYFICLVEAMKGYLSFQFCGMKLHKDSYQLPKDKKQFVEFLTRLFTEGIYR